MMFRVLLFGVAGLFLISNMVAADLPRDSEGWTILTPSPTSRIAYVSSSDGDDATARVYSPSNPAVGPDPSVPSGSVLPFATIAAATDSVRDGQGDWILLKRGDSWAESLTLKNGRSVDEPFVVGAYGNECERPRLKTGSASAFRICCGSFNDIAIVGVAFYAHTRDPNSPDYENASGENGFRVFVGDGHSGTGLLIEDSSFRFYTSNAILAKGGTISDVDIRRSSFLDNYSTGGHSQGLYTDGVSSLLEENVFDHNGWLVQGNGGQDRSNGRATYFNHNIYFDQALDTTLRGNIFLRAASIGNKWRADSRGETRNILIDDNLYVEGEVGLSIGGNTSDAYRFVDMVVRDNVFVDIGRSQPTGRTLGWYIDVQDWDGGVITGNLLLPVNNDLVRNVYGISIGANSGRDITVVENTVYDLETNRAAVVTSGTGKANVTFEGNRIQLPESTSMLIDMGDGFSGYSFSSNTYFAGRGSSEWFRVSGQRASLAQWRDLAPEPSAEGVKLEFVDPERTIETYQQTLGGTASRDEFIAEVRKQSKCNWRHEYTAPRINDWFRDGFASLSLPVPRTLRVVP